MDIGLTEILAMKFMFLSHIWVKLVLCIHLELQLIKWFVILIQRDMLILVLHMQINLHLQLMIFATGVIERLLMKV